MKTKQTSRARLFLCGVALTLLGSSQAYAVTICNQPQPISLTFPPLVFDGGSDGPIIGQPITSGWGAVVTNPTLFNGGADCVIDIGITLPALQGAQVTGITYTEGGQTYPIYATSIPSIGIIIGIKATSAATYTPVVRPVTTFYPNPHPSKGMGVDLQAKLIVTGRLASGVYPLATQTLVRIYANAPGSGGGTTGVSDLILNASTLTITARTCQLSSAAVQNVTLPPVAKTQFSGVGSSPNVGQSFVVSTNCQKGVNLSATMTDAANPANTGNILSPGEGTTASGVGVQILRNDLPVSFGPDSSAKGNLNQWYIGTANNTGNDLFTIPFRARYVQTAANMTAGVVKAKTTITFSYQ